MAKNANPTETAKQVLSTAGGVQKYPKHKNWMHLDPGSSGKWWFLTLDNNVFVNLVNQTIFHFSRIDVLLQKW